MHWFITHHAVERYQRRIDESAEFGAVMAMMRAALPHATRVHPNTYKGQERWLAAAADGTPFIAVAKIDHAMGARVALTVLPPGELGESEEDAGEMLAAYQRVSDLVEANRPACARVGRTPRLVDGAATAEINRLQGRVASLETQLAQATDQLEALPALRAALVRMEMMLRLSAQGEMLVASERRVAKMREHADRVTAERHHLVTVLRRAMAGLHQAAEHNTTAAFAIASVAEMDEHLASKAFAAGAGDEPSAGEAAIV